MQPPTATEFRRLARTNLKPVLTEIGLQARAGVGFGGWVRAERESWLVFWLQLDRRNGTEADRPFAFTAEFQLGPQPMAGTPGVRRRLYGLLTADERHEYARRQAAIDRTRVAPAGAEATDAWFSYRNEADLTRWFEFIARVLPNAVERFLARSAAPTDT